jgi:hypothetical protein
MRLVDMNPRWMNAAGESVTNADGTPVERRTGIGLLFHCPCGRYEDDGGERYYEECYVPFSNPLDGGPQVGGQGWQREGDTFETLTLRPSILRLKWKGQDGQEHGCGWHGFITSGEIQTV